MKKGEVYIGTVKELDFPNKGIVWIDDKKVIVKNTIPNQEIEFRIQKKRNGHCEGQLLRVVTPAKEELSRDTKGENKEVKERIVCPHFGLCGGCQYQTLPYQNQLLLKETQVKKLLDAVIKEPFVFESILGSPIEKGYRNKMEFSFGDEVKDGPLALGMHKRGSFYDVVTTDSCNIVHPDFCKILAATKTYFEELGISFYKKMQHTGYLRHLLVRRAVKTGEILVALVTTTQTEELKFSYASQTHDINSMNDTNNTNNITSTSNINNTNNITSTNNINNTYDANMDNMDSEGARKCLDDAEESVIDRWKEILLGLELEGMFAGILHIQNDSLADVVQSDCTMILYGKEFFYEELLGLKFQISPFSFFQTNSLGAEVLYNKVREYIGDTKDKVVFDLYSGTGTIAQIAASVAKKVVGVEIVEEAVEAAKKNAAGNGLENCEFIAGDVLKVVGTLEDKPDFIVLDPPRDGIHPKALEKIVGFGVDKMVYVSCKPTSLARDLIVLQERGYRVEKACCVDMFPCTSGVETIVLLSKIKTN